jgi:hypothetical protein
VWIGVRHAHDAAAPTRDGILDQVLRRQPADSCSRHTRASRRGGHGNCRAQSSSLDARSPVTRDLRQEPHSPVKPWFVPGAIEPCPTILMPGNW